MWSRLRKKTNNREETTNGKDKDAIRICAHDTDRVRRDFPKLNEKKAELLAASCRAVLILDDLESLLGDANISRDVLDKIVDAYGDRTVEMAKNNAFQFVDVAGFAVSDKIALAAGMARNDARRIRAGVMESVRGVCKKTGCLCAETGAVLSTAYELLGNDVPAVAVQHGCETLCDSYALVKQGRWLYINRNAGSATHEEPWHGHQRPAVRRHSVPFGRSRLREEGGFFAEWTGGE